MLFLFRLLLPCLALVNPTNASVQCYTVVEIEALWKKKNRSDLELNWTTDLLTDKVKWQSHCHQLENTKYTTLNQITIKTTLQHKVDQNITPARIAKLVTRVEMYNNNASWHRHPILWRTLRSHGDDRKATKSCTKGNCTYHKCNEIWVP